MQSVSDSALQRTVRQPAESGAKIRFAGIDIVKITALFLVVTVHAFLNTGFYGTPISFTFGAVQMYFRWAAFCCVPLFMTVTGYLMSRKTLSGKYYAGVLRVLVIYVVISLICVLFNIKYNDFTYTLWHVIRGLFMFTDAQYSWYVEYYLCMFLLIPFLNQAYHGMKTRRNKRFMLMTVCLLFLFAQSFFIGTNPDSQIKIFPSYFTRGYPIAYYLIGAYIRDFPPKLTLRNKLKFLVTYLLALVWVSLVTFYQCLKNTDNNCVWRSWHNDDYASWPVALMTVSLFLLLFDIRIRSRLCSAILAKLSNATFAGYLISYIFDCIYYKKLNNDYQTVPERFLHVPLIVLKVFALSIFSGLVIQGGYDLIAGRIRAGREKKRRIQSKNPPQIKHSAASHPSQEP